MLGLPGPNLSVLHTTRDLGIIVLFAYMEQTQKGGVLGIDMLTGMWSESVVWKGGESPGNSSTE